jgi:methylmalonyl-CoA mutase cobalamin-binding subunit
MRIETLLLHVMAPAARHLGDMWTADLCDFVDVTLALSRLNQILRRIGTGFRDPIHESEQERRALLVPTPGEQHTFGLRIVEEFLLRDGWHVRSNLRADRDEIVDLAAEDDYQVVGFSLSGELLLGELAGVIRDVRRSSQNRTIRVIVGGVIFHEHPHLLGIVDADAIAFDAQHAVSLANKWRQRSR